MGIFYNGKIDIKDMLWKPRLVGDAIAGGIKGIGAKKDSRHYLPMDEYEAESCYPRPQFARESYFSLDGEWDFSYYSKEEIPTTFPYTIQVPFPPQAKRSGLKKKVKDSFWYQKRFTLPEGFKRSRVLLHFGAVDQVARLFVNGHFVGEHEGGYLPFSFDITEYLIEKGENIIQLYCIDDLDPRYPYGKQTKTPGGMWYSQISGIWQSVWMESVPDKRCDSVRCTYRDEENEIELVIKGTAAEYDVTIALPSGEKMQVKAVHGSNRIPLSEIQLWSPENPYLYYFTIATEEDRVESYFALRTISVEKFGGRKMLCLNHRPYFFHGVLDQGYFSDGIYTPVSYRYYEKDIRIMKELGFNTLRKHIKIEPARFYYDCDRLGMVVFQDMVNNGGYSYIRDTIWPTVFPFYIGHFKNDKNIKVPRHIKSFFLRHSVETVEYLYNFPSVLYYTIFNEGWGQFDSEKVLYRIRNHDKTRIYDSASGWYKQNGASDVESIHCYFHKVPIEKWKKPAIVSEFGGYSFMVSAHAAFRNHIFGYGSFENKRDLTRRIMEMYEEEIIPHIKDGICGAIYTQLSDVEEELNGLYTYDRKECKVIKKVMRHIALEIRKAIDAIE